MYSVSYSYFQDSVHLFFFNCLQEFVDSPYKNLVFFLYKEKLVEVSTINTLVSFPVTLHNLVLLPSFHFQTVIFLFYKLLGWCSVLYSLDVYSN